MRPVVIAPDKFKGSLTASQAAQAMARGVERAVPGAAIVQIPMADGGEGTVDALVAATYGSDRTKRVKGPLGEEVEARYGLLGDGLTAVIEMAEASGLKHVLPGHLDPLIATTRGTGELLLAAIEAGVGRVILGIGGSATNDGGAGLGQALGFRLLDSDGRELEPGGGSLGRLARIDPSGRHADLDKIKLTVACDVTNPLCGENGASKVYGKQKGVKTAAMAEMLDANLAHFAAIVERDLGVSIADIPGSGAAGGLGGGLLAFVGDRLEGGRFENGLDLVSREVGLASYLAGASLCLTGEGSLDVQSLSGKTPVGVARLARSFRCRTLAFAGIIGPGVEEVLREEGINACFSICPASMDQKESMDRASELLEEAVAKYVLEFLSGSCPPP